MIEVFAEDLFRSGGIAVHQKRRAQRFADGVEALRPAGLDVGLIRESCVLIGFYCRGVVARADVDVGRHLDQMSRRRSHGGQLVRAGQRAFRRCRGFHGVNVVVDGAHVVGIAFEHRFERSHNLFRAGFPGSVLVPQAPGVQIHTGFGEQRGRIQVIGKFRRHSAHGIVISLGRLPAIGFGIRREPQRHGLNVGLLRRRSVVRELHRFLDGTVCLGKAVVAGGIVCSSVLRLRPHPSRRSQVWGPPRRRDGMNGPPLHG